MAPDEQLQDLTARYQLLEGERKATQETAKLNKQQNQEIINQMKDENKILRDQITKLRNEKPQSAEKQLEGVQHEVMGLQRKVDAVRAENAKRNHNIQQLDVKLSELMVGSKLHTSEASPEMRQIRVLENRLDKAMIKHNEAQSIRKTYEAIVKRLKEERIGFDNQLAAIERTLKAKERDYEELLLLSHDAYHAKEMAQAELHRFEQGVMEERNQRDKEVQDKKALVEQRVKMNQRLEQREKVLKMQLEAEKQSERHQRDPPLGGSDLNASIASDYQQEERQKLLDYEEAFHAIKEATGVDNPNEVIQKFLTQEDTQRDLKKLTNENQATIDRLTEERRKLRLQVDELKFGSDGSVGRRQAIDDFEAHLSDAQEKFDRSRGKFERTAKLLIDMKSGIGHLAEKMGPIRLDGETTIPMTDETVEEVLQQCELKVSKLQDMAHEDDVNDARQLVDDDLYEEKLLLKSQSGARIRLAEKEEDGDGESDDFDEDMDEDVLQRDQVKHNSITIMNKVNSKNKKKSKKAKKDE